MTAPNGPDAPARIPSLLPVLGVGFASVVGAGIAFGAHVALSTAAGAALGVLDLWLLTRMVRAMVAIEPSRQGARWAPLVLIKFLLLFTGVILLLSRNVFLPLPFLAGLAALPVGIVVGTLFRE